MNLAHKIQLFPNTEQRIALAKAAGCSRFTYNWALAKWTEMYEAKKGNNTLPAPSALGLKKELESEGLAVPNLQRKMREQQHFTRRYKPPIFS